MPPIKKQYLNDESIPSRTAPLIGRYDVLVVGGGPAGIGASLGAARTGASVILAERYGCLGGSSTNQLVNPFMSTFTQKPILRTAGKIALFPIDHGIGTQIIKGVFSDLVEQLVAMQGAIPPSFETGYIVPFDPEILKIAAIQMIDAAGVDTLVHAFASTFLPDKEYPGVVFETKSGPVVIRAKCIVDCTGDGDIAFLAGAPYKIGRNSDGLMQPMTLYFRVGGFEKNYFYEYIQSHPEQWYGVFGLWDLIEKATKDGMKEFPREDILLFAGVRDTEVSVNSTRVLQVSGIDIWDINKAEWESRYQVKQIMTFLQKYVPGFQNSFLMQTAPQIGIRETRRIMGDYVLTGNDVMKANKFYDAIACCAYPLDIHNPLGKGTRIEKLPSGDYYEVPLRSLLPENCTNILVAGRCISGTHEAHSSYRIMPEALATGQAAGILAAFASKKNTDIRSIHYSKVQQELRDQGAVLPNFIKSENPPER
jgi:hypothetical protein